MAAEVSVLLAEHEPEVAELSARYLRRDGLDVRLVTAPEAALAGLTHGLDAAAVLDLTMPGLDPRRIRRALRTPAVFLAGGAGGAGGAARAGGPKVSRPRGLSADRGPGGPRRWLGRPFSPRHLVMLVREVLAQPVPRQPVPGQPVPLQQAIQGWPAGLTPAERAMLAAMLDRRGQVLSRRQLLAAAGRDKASDRAADVHIAQLRAKMGTGAAIRTVRGAGYVIDA
jgi:DNA-binding response OmpR family regulator